VLQTLKQAHQLQKSGKLPEAERLYRQILKQDVNNVVALNLLGVLCINSGRANEAEKLIGKALRLKPDDPSALVNFALALKDTGKRDQAIKALQRSLSLGRKNPFALNSLGSLLLDSGQAAQALTQYRRALKLAPDYADCWCNLSIALNQLLQFEEALQAGLEARRVAPKNPLAHYCIAESCRSLSRYAEAIKHYKQALLLRPTYFEAMLSLANTYREANFPDEARAALQDLLRAYPDSAEAFSAMAVLQEQLGNLDDAAVSVKRALSQDPGQARLHYQLAQMKGRESTLEEAQAIEALVASGEVGSEDLVLLHFALACVYEQHGRNEEAFSAWTTANAAKAEHSPYDESETVRFFGAVIKHTASARDNLPNDAGFDGARALFIVGMPRSGTTLTGQILASHPSISSLGEISFAHDMADRVQHLTGLAYPAGLARLTPAQCRELGEEFVGRLSGKGDSANYFIDNTPLNYQHIGLLSLILPDAKFIHCQRDPIDTCFSMFKLPFADNQNFAHSLVSLGKQYGHYRELMASWKQLLPTRIIDVRYEDTVADLESQSRRLLDYLELPFDSAVHNFHRAGNLVRTPSASQVRRPIYKDAVQAWKRYERQLQPLIEQLANR
jgi:tetratricopeptide (TPR) repeat protein